MGARLHKMIGYGLIDVATDSDGRLADPRINTKSHLLKGAGSAIVDSYLGHLLLHGGQAGDHEADLILGQAKGKSTYRFDPRRAAVCHPRANGLSVLCLRPVWLTD